jgi:peptidoglycan/xylan/chitin deacetylase (PgdA/CDA1 family)
LTIHEAWDELAESRRILSNVLGAPITTVAFPYGDYDPSTIDLAKSAGYERAFASLPVHPSAAVHGFLVGRVNVSPRDWPTEFALKAVGAYEWHGPAVAFKNRLRRLFRRNTRRNDTRVLTN